MLCYRNRNIKGFVPFLVRRMPRSSRTAAATWNHTLVEYRKVNPYRWWSSAHCWVPENWGREYLQRIWECPRIHYHRLQMVQTDSLPATAEAREWKCSWGPWGGHRCLHIVSETAAETLTWVPVGQLERSLQSYRESLCRLKHWQCIGLTSTERGSRRDIPQWHRREPCLWWGGAEGRFQSYFAASRELYLPFARKKSAAAGSQTV